MTVIIGIKHQGDVWLGADSYLGSDHSSHVKGQSKIFHCHVPGGGPMVMGSSGSTRAAFLIRSMAFPEHPEGMDAYTYVAETLVSAIRERYSKAGYLENENGREKDRDTQLIIGYQGRLFDVYYDFDVNEYAEDYAAIGAAQYIALGALHVIANRLVVPTTRPVDMLRVALKACEHHSPWVRRPFVIMKVEEPKEHAAGPTVPPD